MAPKEMQERIEHLREDAHVLHSIADEPGQNPVHPEGVVERDESRPHSTQPMKKSRRFFRVSEYYQQLVSMSMSNLSSIIC